MISLEPYLLLLRANFLKQYVEELEVPEQLWDDELEDELRLDHVNHLGELREDVKLVRVVCNKGQGQCKRVNN